mgnify:CR=1 FL=1
MVVQQQTYHDVIGNVVLDQSVVGTVNGDGTLETVVDTVAADVRVRLVACHVQVVAVAPQHKALTALTDLCTTSSTTRNR